MSDSQGQERAMDIGYDNLEDWKDVLDEFRAILKQGYKVGSLIRDKQNNIFRITQFSLDPGDSQVTIIELQDSVQQGIAFYELYPLGSQYTKIK